MRIGRISHDVSPERLHEGDPRILATAAATGTPLIIGLRFQCDTKPLNIRWVASLIELHASNADARIISLCDQPREEIELAVWTARGRRIQDALDLMGISGSGSIIIPMRCNLHSFMNSHL
jgi:hypothetical protein